MMRPSLVVLAVVVVAACGGEVVEGTGLSGTGGPGGGASAAGGSGAASGTGASGPGSSGSGAAGGGLPGDWELLVEGDWSLSGGSESYTCVIATVPEEIYVHAIRPITPEGTHHTVLTVGADGPDGTFPCGAATNGQNMIYGSGVNTEARVLPEGVAIKLAAGDKVLLNLHLFNAFPEPLEGTSGIEIQRMDPAEVEHEATAILAGPLDLNIPPQSTVTETGHCTLAADATVFAVGPHLHQLGTHMTVTALTDSGSQILHDDDYSFDDQQAFPVEPAVQLQAGDQLKIDCTYTNTTNQQVGWGESSNAEMCFATTFLYPASGAFGFLCTN